MLSSVLGAGYFMQRALILTRLQIVLVAQYPSLDKSAGEVGGFNSTVTVR